MPHAQTLNLTSHRPTPLTATGPSSGAQTGRAEFTSLLEHLLSVGGFLGGPGAGKAQENGPARASSDALRAEGTERKIESARAEEPGHRHPNGTEEARAPEDDSRVEDPEKDDERDEEEPVSATPAPKPAASGQAGEPEADQSDSGTEPPKDTTDPGVDEAGTLLAQLGNVSVSGARSADAAPSGQMSAQPDARSSPTGVLIPEAEGNAIPRSNASGSDTARGAQTGAESQASQLARSAGGVTTTTGPGFASPPAGQGSGNGGSGSGQAAGQNTSSGNASGQGPDQANGLTSGQVLRMRVGPTADSANSTDAKGDQRNQALAAEATRQIARFALQPALLTDAAARGGESQTGQASTVATGASGAPAPAGTSGAAPASPHGQAGATLTSTLSLDSPSHESVDQVARVLRAHVGSRQSQLQIQLDPPALGRVRIDIRIQNDVLRLNVETETEAGRDLLSSRMLQLRDALQQHGISMERASVQVRTTVQNTGQAREEQSHPPSQDGQRGAPEQPTDQSHDANRHDRPADRHDVPAASPTDTDASEAVEHSHGRGGWNPRSAAESWVDLMA